MADNDDDRPPLESFKKRPPLSSFAKKDVPPPRPQPGELIKAVTDIPAKVGEEYSGAVGSIRDFGEWARGPGAAPNADIGTIWEGLKKGAGAAGSLAYLGTGVGPALGGAYKSIIGHGLEAVGPSAGHPEAEAIKQQAELAPMLLAPEAGGAAAARIPPRPSAGPMGITTPRGEIPKTLGAAGEDRVKKFLTQALGQSQTAKERISESFDTLGGQRVAKSAVEAGEVVSRAVQQADAIEKANVSQAFELAKSLPGEIDAMVFDDIGNEIKKGLTGRADPIIIDDGLTPLASRAIRDVEQRIEQLKIQNRADPTRPVGGGGFMSPRSQGQVVGVNLAGVDQMRRRLGAFRKAAYQSKNEVDYRAASAVMDQFDGIIRKAIKSPAFSGDPMAAKAWDYARELHSDYRSTFKSSGRGTVGDVVQNIVRGREGDPAIANDVADFIYGGTGVNPKSLQVGVAKRLEEILGRDSPEWAAVRQGLLERIVAPPKGKTAADLKIQKAPRYLESVADRLTQFLRADGKEMAEFIYTPQERAMLTQLAGIHRQLEITRTGMGAPWMHSISDRVAQGANLMIAGSIGHGGALALMRGALIGAAKYPAKKLAELREASSVAKQLPILTEEIAKWQRAVLLAQRMPGPAGRRQAAIATGALAKVASEFGIDIGAGVGGDADVGPGAAPMPPAPPQQPQQPPQYGGPMQ